MAIQHPFLLLSTLAKANEQFHQEAQRSSAAPQKSEKVRTRLFWNQTTPCGIVRCCRKWEQICRSQRMYSCFEAAYSISMETKLPPLPWNNSFHCSHGSICHSVMQVVEGLASMEIPHKFHGSFNHAHGSPRKYYNNSGRFH